MNINDTIEYLIDTGIYVYRLKDGTQIVAEEIEISDDRLLVSFPAKIDGNYGEFTLNVWNIFQSIELTEINPNHIISKSEAQLVLKAHYYNFIMANTVYAEDTSDNTESAYEILEHFLDNYDAIDNLDSSKYSKRWDWDPNLN